MENNFSNNEKWEQGEEELPVLILIKQNFVEFNSVKRSNMTNNLPKAQKQGSGCCRSL